jgi:ABC-2 type transport system ATP-binding protein
MDPVIAVESLTKAFRTRREGPVTAVDHISFDVQRGEVFGFLGPNGAGKTTTIRMLLGLMRPTSGRATVLGHRLPNEAKALHTRTGYMSQIFTLYDELTPVENLRFYGRVYGLSTVALRQREAEIISMASLAGREHERTANLSGGWRQRLALGCAIIHDPELIFLDEPTAGVDPVSRRDFWELIYQLAEDGTTVFVTTHYMDEAELCQRLALISGGRLVALGTPEEFKTRWMGGHVIEIDCEQPDTAMRVLRGASGTLLRASDLSFYGAQIHAVVPDADSAQAPIRQLLASEHIPVNSIEWIEPSLEDVFISRMRRPAEGWNQALPMQPTDGGGT